MTKTLAAPSSKAPSINDNRAAWAEAAFLTFLVESGSDREDGLGDLLCDLMHWADRNNFDFGLALERAAGHYEIEVVEDC